MLDNVRPEWSERKAHQDYVTDVDWRIQNFLERELSKLLPGVPVIGEENASNKVAPDGRWWIVDPLDGTGNFIAGLPITGISVALVDAQGPRLAVVAAPNQKRLWAAERGRGATVNGASMRVPPQPSELIVVSTGFLDGLFARSEGHTWTTLRDKGKLRNLGAQAIHLCGVAEGWFAAALSVEARVWDEAAGGLIVREAGAVWKSRADALDWSNPQSLLEVTRQDSLACHPLVDIGSGAISALRF